MQSREYLSCADTAKLVRQAIKEAFPGVAFSVKSKTYAGGASITVRWTDGPTDAEVRSITGRFEGATFDGMIDLKTSVTSYLDGRPVRFGADYIFRERSYSDAEINARLAFECKRWGVAQPVTAEDYRQGRLWNIRTASMGNNALDVFVNRGLAATTLYWPIKPSPTAERVGAPFDSREAA